jgi:hypothetical protein
MWHGGGQELTVGLDAAYADRWACAPQMTGDTYFTCPLEVGGSDPVVMIIMICDERRRKIGAPLCAGRLLSTPLKHHLHITLAIAAVLLLIGSLSLLNWGLWGSGRFMVRTDHRLLAASAKSWRLQVMYALSDAPLVAVAYQRRSIEFTFANGAAVLPFDPEAPLILSSSLGFSYDGMNFSSPNHHLRYVRRATIPQWSLQAVAGLLATVTAVPLVRRHMRHRRARCRTCGCDLRASPQRCPECGAPAPGVHASPQHDPATDASTPLNTIRED